MPVLDADLSTAAYDRLSSHLVFSQMVADGLIGTDAAASAPLSEKIEKAWLFQGLDSEGRPFRDPEGTGKCVIVLMEDSTWSAPNRHNTPGFPMLRILLYADSTRDAQGVDIGRDARRKAKHADARLDECFHLVAPKITDHQWGEMWVHSSYRSNARDIQDVPGTQSSTVRIELRFEVITD